MRGKKDAPLTLIRYDAPIEEPAEEQLRQKAVHEEILESMVPAREWTDHNNKLYVQYVSHHPASREDVMDLEKRLNHMLEDRQARLKGICPIREELFSQAFDEIIRQVAVDCPQRGLLLMRVRDEHKMTVAAYETVYQSGVAYGIQKQIESEEGTDHLQCEEQALLQAKHQLEERKLKLLCEKELVEKTIKENKGILCDQWEEELTFLRNQTQCMTKFLDSVKLEFR